MAQHSIQIKLKHYYLWIPVYNIQYTCTCSVHLLFHFSDCAILLCYHLVNHLICVLFLSFLKVTRKIIIQTTWNLYYSGQDTSLCLTPQARIPHCAWLLGSPRSHVQWGILAQKSHLCPICVPLTALSASARLLASFSSNSSLCLAIWSSYSPLRVVWLLRCSFMSQSIFSESSWPLSLTSSSICCWSSFILIRLLIENSCNFYKVDAMYHQYFT